MAAIISGADLDGRSKKAMDANGDALLQQRRAHPPLPGLNFTPILIKSKLVTLRAESIGSEIVLAMRAMDDPSSVS